MKRKSFKGGALTAPVPAAIVTVGNMEKYGMLTVSWTGILATVPPKTYVSIRPSRHSYAILKEGGEFVVNLPSADMARAVDYIGIYSGKKVDKFSKCALTKIESERVSAPTVAECPIAIECVVTEVIPMGSHDVFVADIVNVSCKEELVDGDGKICFDRANLLAYAHGEYFTLGERVGKFGFSTDKKQKSEPKSKNQEAKRVKSEPEKEKKAKSDASQAKKPSTGLPQAKKSNIEPSQTKKQKSEPSEIKAASEYKKPFYLGVTGGKRARQRNKDVDKGRPHGKRTKKIKEVK